MLEPAAVRSEPFHGVDAQLHVLLVAIARGVMEGVEVPGEVLHFLDVLCRNSSRPHAGLARLPAGAHAPPELFF